MKTTMTIFNTSGKEEGHLDLPEYIFQAKVNPELVAQAVRVYLHNQRQGSALTQNRSDVSYTKAKMYRQKGTGRARHGARSAPIFVGGGVAHGPASSKHYHLSMSKTMRRQALFSVLTDKVNQKAVTIVKGMEKLDGKTKSVQVMLKSLNVPTNKPVLLMLDKTHTAVIRATRSLDGVHATQIKRMNTYEIMNHAHLIMTPECLDVLTAMHPNEKNSTRSNGDKKE